MDIARLGRDRLPALSFRLGPVGVAVVLTAAALLVSSGCSISRAIRPGSYTVQRGDTLSEIGQRYNIDWHKLARWNHIGPPYRINIGQQLTLKPYPRLDYAHMSTAPTGSSNPGRERRPRRPPADQQSKPNGHVQALHAPGAPVVTRNPVPTTSNAPNHASKPPAPSDHGSNRNADNGAGQHPASRPEHSIDNATASAATRQTTVKAGGPSADGWQWPAGGPLKRAYDPSARRRGIEIGGHVGDPIDAASSGTVVYNGSGLKGYGKLIIIKHDRHYLSAYGFVDQSRVKQGQTVAAGAHIANMGLGPGNKPMLHFEIRHDGDPIDPQKVLPKR